MKHGVNKCPGVEEEEVSVVLALLEMKTTGARQGVAKEVHVPGVSTLQGSGYWERLWCCREGGGVATVAA